MSQSEALIPKVFNRVCFDQLEQFSETQYTYMFSRLRRTKNYPIPWRNAVYRQSIGANWVKKRFVSDVKEPKE